MYPTDIFKFDVSGSWTQQYGDTNSDRTADYMTGSGGDIYFPAYVNGFAIVQLNGTNLSYTISTENSQEEKTEKNAAKPAFHGIFS